MLRARAALLLDLGPSLSPQNAFQLLQGLETLPLGIRRQFDNAAKVADFLAAHPKVVAFIRPSIGIEDPNDIIADIAHALDGV